jgi:hypothetical protein
MAGILFAVLVGTGTIQPFQAIGAAFPYLRGDNVRRRSGHGRPSSDARRDRRRMGMRKVE